MDREQEKRASESQSFSGFDLYDWRERMRLTQQQAADLIGVSRRSITRWENRLGGALPRIVGLACRGAEKESARR